jgi:hypothetical protein
MWGSTIVYRSSFNVTSGSYKNALIRPSLLSYIAQQPLTYLTVTPCIPTPQFHPT